MDKQIELAELMFPEIKETIGDLEAKYPPRNLIPSAEITRFAPSPTGYLHTGSLFTSLVSYYLAKSTKGVFYVRLEDTDTKREIKGAGEALIKELKNFNIAPMEGYGTNVGRYAPYEQSKRANIYKTVIKELVKQGLAYPCFCTPEELDEIRQVQEKTKQLPGYYGSYAKCRYLKPEEAIKLIKEGKAYVWHQSKKEMSEYRDQKRDSPYRNRTVEENLKLFEMMRQGRFEEKECCLRMKIDMTHVNPCMRDPVAYRIKYVPHPHAGDKWCIYPTYDFTHCLCDSLENITHSLCTLEFEIRRDSYYWLLEAADMYRPFVWEYSRLNLTKKARQNVELKFLVYCAFTTLFVLFGLILNLSICSSFISCNIKTSNK